MENKEKEESKEKEVKRGVKIVQLDRSLGGFTYPKQTHARWPTILSCRKIHGCHVAEA